MGENKEKATIVFNISGGSNQVLPNATHAIMNINGGKADSGKPRQLLSHDFESDGSLASEHLNQPSKGAGEDSERTRIIDNLKLRINDDSRLADYQRLLLACETATDLARVIVGMYHKEKEWLKEFEIKKERFIKSMLTLAPNVTKGNTVSNIRARIKAELNNKE